jgi:quinol monooxygenase YgiN
VRRTGLADYHGATSARRPSDSQETRPVTIHVIANIELHTGHRGAFLNELRKLVPLVLAEDGCIEYGPAIDIPSGIGAQQPIRDHVVIIVEKWQTLDHLKQHLTAPHMTVYREAVREMVLVTKLFVLEPA